MTLRVLLREYPAELEADLHDKGIDILDVYRGVASLRKIANIAANLPPGSAVWRAEGGPLAWSDETHMLSAIEYNTHVLYWLKTKDGSKGKNPPKPHQPPPSKSQQAANEARAMRALDKRRARAATRARLNKNST